MEIKKESKRSRKARRTTFLVLLILVNVVLVAGLWQYHRLLVELYDGVSSRFLVTGFGRRAPAFSAQPIRIGLVRSEASALALGEYRAGYDEAVEFWQRFLETERFGYRLLDDVPVGADADPYNLLVLPAMLSVTSEQRDAIKAFLASGRGVVMTWATGSRDGYGQWESYSLVQEIGGMDMGGPPPPASERYSRLMISGGYPITADMHPGFRLDIAHYNQPMIGLVREHRTLIDGVWVDPASPSFELYSVRDRAAIVHGNYLDGRFLWLGFTANSGGDTPEQRSAMHSLLRNATIWAAHQVLAFKPTWPDRLNSVVSITQDIHGPEDVDPRVLALAQKHRVPLTSFVHVGAMQEHPELLGMLVEAGEVGVLGDPDMDFESARLPEQQAALTADRKALEALTGVAPAGFRLVEGRAHSAFTLDALARAGYGYFSTRAYDRMVPKIEREHRSVALVTVPRQLWTIPQMPYQPVAEVEGGNPLIAQFAQINALEGYYCLSFRPSRTDGAFLNRLDALLERVKREHVWVAGASAVTDVWGDWDQIKISARMLSRRKTSLKISNTGRHAVDNVIVQIEMPDKVEVLDIESMTLGTALPTSMTQDGVIWRLELSRLAPGKNVTYYVTVPERQVADRR